MPTHVAPRRDFHGLEVRRKQAARLFAAGRETQGAIARRLGVSRQSVMRWYQAWHAGGREALRAAGRAGRKPRLAPEQVARIDTALREGARAHGFSTALWTLPRVALVIKRVTGVKYHPGHVWRLLGALDWTLQRPAKRAKERNETAVRHWVTTRWPAVKKRSASPGLDRLPRRERGLAAAARPPHMGPARGDPCPDPCLQLVEALSRGGVGVPLGRAPQ
jgi:transposase